MVTTGITCNVKRYGLLNWPEYRCRMRKRRLNRFYSNWIKKFHKGKGTLLDIGCGDGAFLAHMKDSGWEVFGVEVDSAVISGARDDLKNNIRLIKNNLTEAGFARDKFDVVSLWNAFEHIADSAALLESIKLILKKNGSLALQVPNIESLESRIFKEYWIHLDPPRHIHHFSLSSLTSTLLQKRFNVLAITYSSPIDKSYRGSFAKMAVSRFGGNVDSYLFHNIFYKVAMDLIFVPLTIISNTVKMGTFITVACVNEK